MENKGKPRSLKDLIKENIIDYKLEGEIIEEIKLSSIKPNPQQPRKRFDEEKINELAESIKVHGVFQPIIVKKISDEYLIVSGERRYRASLKAGLTTIPAIVRQYDANKLAEIALLENLQREDLTPIEEAFAYQSMMERFGFTHLELSKQIGKSRSHVTNLLGLLKLPSEVRELVSEKKLSMGHARALSKLNNEKEIIELSKKIIAKDLSVRQIESLLKNKNNNKERAHVYKEASQEKEITEKIKDINLKYNVTVKYEDKCLTFASKNEEDIKKIIDMLLKK